MKEYIYHFADGTSSVVEVEDKLYDVLIEMSHDEYNRNRNYNRNNCALSKLDYQGDEFIDPRGDGFDSIMREQKSERVRAALDLLTEAQRELIEKVYYEGLSVNKIAEEYGIDQTSVSHRLMRLKKKLKKFLL